MYSLVIKPAAVLMAKESYEWYELQKPGLSEEFLLELDNCYNKIEEHPEYFGKVKGNFRQAALKRFPFVVVFEIFKSWCLQFFILKEIGK